MANESSPQSDDVTDPPEAEGDGTSAEAAPKRKAPRKSTKSSPRPKKPKATEEGADADEGAKGAAPSEPAVDEKAAETAPKENGAATKPEAKAKAPSDQGDDHGDEADDHGGEGDEADDGDDDAESRSASAKSCAAKSSAAKPSGAKPSPAKKRVGEEDEAADGEDEDEDDDLDDEELKDAKPEKKRSRWRDLIGVLICVAVVLFARASLIDHYVVPTGSMEPTVGVDDRVIVSKAAYGLRVPLTDFWLFRWGGPKRGDVVVLESPPQEPKPGPPGAPGTEGDDGGTILLKRVIGLPGDTVMVREGKITVNGKEMDLANPTDGDETHYTEDLEGKKHYVSLKMGGGPPWGPITLPDGKTKVPDCRNKKTTDEIPPRMYLVMGDNRGNSKDGRIFGCVNEDAILGHAIKIYYSKGFVWRNL